MLLAVLLFKDKAFFNRLAKRQAYRFLIKTEKIKLA
jgi:hypothetical protein